MILDKFLSQHSENKRIYVRFAVLTEKQEIYKILIYIAQEIMYELFMSQKFSKQQRTTFKRTFT